MPDFFQNNLSLLKARFPHVADFATSIGAKTIGILQSRDGASFFAVKEADGRWRPISNPDNPVELAQRSLNSMMHRIVSGLSPAVVVGLAPGYTLDTIFGHFKSRLKYSEPFRHIYVIVDSAECLACWLSASDRSHILRQDEVEFLLASEAGRIVELCEKDLSRSHLFVPVSELPEPLVSRIIRPLADLYLKRERETEEWRRENDEYYDAMSDEELAKAIQGKAGRKPRLMMPTHTSSTVVQYSARDTCEAFERLGWETRILKIERDLPPWHLTKAIHDFKPDLFIFINHLRTEDGAVQLYPKSMLFATWVQDAMPAINNSKAAELWNKAAERGKRDILIGYVLQLKKYGYKDELLANMPMIVNTRIFRPVELTPEQRARYACDICFASNRSHTTEWILENELHPALERHGLSIECSKDIHDALWRDYRAGRTFTNYESLQARLLELPAFKAAFEALPEENQDHAVQRIFWLLNDVIYRHTVLEWLDEYAQATPGFKLHLYGHGWEEHPRFRRYAKGSMEHGSELNLAYNGAKFCLHLNSIESQHQRLMEIIASGGTPLTRGTPPPSPPPAQTATPLNKAFKKLAMSDASDNFGLLLQEEMEALNDFIFSHTLRLLKQTPPPPEEDLPDAIASVIDRQIRASRGRIPLSTQRHFNERDALYSLLGGNGSNHEERRAAIDEITGFGHAERILSSIIPHSLGSDGLKKRAMESGAPSLAKLLLRPDCAHEEFSEAFDKVRLPGPGILCASFNKLTAWKDAERIGRIAERLKATHCNTAPTLNATLSLILFLMSEGDFEKARVLTEELDFGRWSKEELHPHTRLRLLFVGQVIASRESPLPLDSILEGQDAKIVIDILKPYSNALPRRLAQASVEATDSKALSWIVQAVSREDAAFKGERLESPASLNTKLSFILHFMKEGGFDKARALAEGLDFGRWAKEELHPHTRLRLLFVGQVIASRESPLPLDSILEGRDTPVAVASLRPYSTFLMRKAELPCLEGVEAKAVQWILQAVLKENAMLQDKGNDITQLVKWSVLANQTTEALALAKRHYERHPSYAGAYACLSINLWFKGCEQMAGECLAKERFELLSNPIFLLPASACFATAGKAAMAAECLERLFRLDSRYLESPQKIPVQWIMLSLTLKSMGHDSLSRKALRMSERMDAFHSFRSHHWERIPLGRTVYPFPNFEMPSDFMQEEKYNGL